MSEVFEAWNQIADNHKLPKCLQVSDKRRRSLEVRLHDPFFQKNWKTALGRIASSNFCKGESTRGWIATFDWFIQPDSVVKIIEGKYDNRSQTNPTNNPRLVGVSRNNPVNIYGAIEGAIEASEFEA